MIPAKRSRLFTAWFARHVEKRFKKSFHAVRIRGLDQLRDSLEQGPALAVSNHTSWWDPMMIIFLAYRILHVDGYALMDEKNLRRLPFLGRIGGFGVDLEDREDGQRAVRYAASLLSEPGRLVWIFPQGSERPSTEAITGFKPGAAVIARLARQQVSVLPVGMRYVVGAFERPDALISIGSPLAAETDIEAGRLAQQQAVADEVGRIDRYLNTPSEAEGFEPIFIQTPSMMERLAERWLARLTRYRFPS